MIELDNNKFLTTNTPLAAYLIQEGFTLCHIQYEIKDNGRRQGTFVFDSSNLKLHECVSLYNRGEAMINLALYEHAKSKLIDRILRGAP